MAKKSLMAKIGVWAYIAGIVIAILFGLLVLLDSSGGGLPNWAIIVLAVLGVIVGLLNISDEEVLMFLVGSIAFVVAATSMSGVFALAGWDFMTVMMNAIVIFTAPGALVVAFKALYAVAHDD